MNQEIVTLQSDERLGLPSASSMDRIFGCPASLALTNKLRAEGRLPVDRGSEDAERGTRIHALLESFANGEAEHPKDSPEEVEEAQALWDEAQRIIVATFGEPVENLNPVVEKRLWLYGSGGKKAMSGKPDLVIVRKQKALVLDYKTGHREVVEPSKNLQLQTLAVMVWETYPEVLEIHGGILQSHTKPVLDKLELHALDRLRRIAIDHFEKSATHHPLSFGFNPTEDNCRYCPCRGNCPRLADDMAAVVRAMSGHEALSALVTSPTPALSDFLVKCDTVKELRKSAAAEMTARLEAGESDDNWHLAASAPRRQVTDPLNMARALIGAGAETDAVLGAMSITVGNAERLLPTTGIKKTDAKAELNKIGGAYIGMTEPQLSLKRKPSTN